MFTFDYSINLGQIITTVGFLVGAIGVIYTMRGDINMLKEKVTAISLGMTKIGDLLVTIGRQDERLNSFEHRLDRLER